MGFHLAEEGNKLSLTQKAFLVEADVGTLENCILSQGSALCLEKLSYFYIHQQFVFFVPVLPEKYMVYHTRHHRNYVQQLSINTATFQG